MSLAFASSNDAARLTHQNEVDAEERLNAARRLSGDPALSTFFDVLYAHAAPDDVNRYEPRSLSSPGETRACAHLGAQEG